MAFSPDQLHVISVIMNPVGWSSRYRNYMRFAQEMRAAGVSFYTVEAALPEQKFSVTEEGNPRHLQLRYTETLWQKEAMINQALQRLPASAEYVAWIDADVSFVRPSWPTDIIAFLQAHPIVQVFETAVELGPEDQALAIAPSFASWYRRVYSQNRLLDGPFSQRHPGYGWAARRELLKDGLFDKGIIGSGDLIMAYCMIGRSADLHTLLGLKHNDPRASTGLQAEFTAWQNIVAPKVAGRLGFVPGTLLHHWHGAREHRGYVDRWRLLNSAKYDPRTDIRRTADGLWEFTDAGSRLREDFKAYFRSRNEDSTK